MLATILCANAAMAQRRAPAPRPLPAPVRRDDTTIKATTLEVYQLYQPELKPLSKAELTPVLPQPPAAPAPQQYEVPQQTLYYSYRALPLRPLALGKDSLVPTPQNYAFLAVGNLATLLGEVGIGSLHGKDWQSAFTARYITQQGTLEGQVFRSFSLKGGGTLQRSRHLFEGSVAATRNVFGRYGYNHDVQQYSFDQVRAAYGGVRLAAGAKNTAPGPWGIAYHPLISASFFRAGRIAGEQRLDIDLPVSKALDSSWALSFGVHSSVAITSFDTGGSFGNNVFSLRPAFHFHRNAFRAALGASPTLGHGGNFYLLPDVQVAYTIGNAPGIVIAAGWKGDLLQNTAEALFTTNPYISTFAGGAQTHSDEVFGTLSVPLGRHLSVYGRAAWWQWQGLPQFVAATGGDGKDFAVLYDGRVRAVAFGGGIRFAIGDDFVIDGEGTAFNYYQHTLAHVYSAPALRIKGTASWRVGEPLFITAYSELLGSIWGQNAQGVAVLQRGVIDFGLSGEYTIAKRFGLLIRAENLLNRRNERWLGYPSFGFNIYGGLRFRF